MPAHTVQIFYGTILHEVLDRAHHHWSGLDNPATKGTLPTDTDIEGYFKEVESSLRARGIRTVTKDLRQQAIDVLKRFNKVEGPTLYPRVVDTESRVRGNRGNYLMEGVVYVLVGDPSTPTTASDPSKWEIWDYKGQRRPAPGKELDQYIYQMQVYSALFEIKYGCLPKAAKLYFMNELDDDSITSTPPKAILDPPITQADISTALSEFDKTAAAIINFIANDKWDAQIPSLAL